VYVVRIRRRFNPFNTVSICKTSKLLTKRVTTAKTMSDCFYFRHLIFKNILPMVGSCRYYFLYIYVGNMIYDLQRLSILCFHSINILKFTI